MGGHELFLIEDMNLEMHSVAHGRYLSSSLCITKVACISWTRRRVAHHVTDCAYSKKECRNTS